MPDAKIVVVTGSNQGIGYGIVRRFLKDDADWIVYLTGNHARDLQFSKPQTSRSEISGKEAVEDLSKENGLKRMPRFHQLDITDSSSVLRFKEYLRSEHGGIDVLINNAGISIKDADISSYIKQAEITLKTNYFATRFMFDEFFSLLREGARVVNVASMRGESALRKLGTQLKAAFTRQPPLTCDEVTQYMEKFIDDVRSGEFSSQGWPDDSAYSVSKLGVIALTFGQQIILDKDLRKDLVVNCCCPGYVATSMTSHKGHKTIDEGADTPFYLATLPTGTEIRGKYVSGRAVRQWK